ncbi:cyclin-T1-3 [Elaeis guineensis]|uniref:Cyclin-T1-3 n=1 Tax=Elaeis guineensis var. tenera TaxID=51953 RepID=A0A6I9SDA6_ELAGV|nr:cyclin-T1-3 [Elaeis guineensis]
MAGFYPAESLHHGAVKSGSYSSSYDKREESDRFGSGWYFSRKEIEENSPSRRDGIDLKKETYLRKSYCTFLQDLGMRLKVPQVTIATAIVFCHRFFLRQSHAKNDRRTIATVCMFLAGKVEETPRPLKDVILVSYEIMHKKDPSAVQKIKQKEVYEQQKEFILLGERVVLATLGFDLNVHHPYKPLVEAIKRFKVAQNALAQVAWNFVNDGLRTSLCLQFMPHHVAAGAIFLAAKFLKVKLPSDGEKVWWQEFDVTPRQLEDVSNQMLELYEQNRGQPSHANEVERSTGGGTNQHAPATSTVSESSVSVNGPAQDAGGVNFKRAGQPQPPARSVGSQSHVDNYRAGFQSTQKSNDNWSADSKSMIWDHNMDTEDKDCSHHEMEKVSGCRESTTEASRYRRATFDRPLGDAATGEKGKTMETKEWKDERSFATSSSTGGQNFKYGETAKGYCPPDAITKIDKDKVKAALEKTRKVRNDAAKKTDIMDEDDLIERELENGIELVVEDEKIKQDRRPAWPNPLNKKEIDNEHTEQVGSKDTRNFRASEHQASQEESKFRSTSEDKTDVGCGFEPDQAYAEEGELSSLDEHEFPSPKVYGSNGKVTNTRYPLREVSGTGRLDGVKRKRDGYEGPPPNLVSEKDMGMGRHSESVQRYGSFHPSREATGTGCSEYTDRDHRRYKY